VSSPSIWEIKKNEKGDRLLFFGEYKRNYSSVIARSEEDSFALLVTAGCHALSGLAMTL
jgi:hypothetical protein